MTIKSEHGPLAQRVLLRPEICSATKQSFIPCSEPRQAVIERVRRKRWKDTIKKRKTKIAAGWGGRAAENRVMCLHLLSLLGARVGAGDVEEFQGSGSWRTVKRGGAVRPLIPDTRLWDGGNDGIAVQQPELREQRPGHIPLEIHMVHVTWTSNHNPSHIIVFTGPYVLLAQTQHVTHFWL